MAMQSNPHLSNVLFEIDEVIEQAIHEEVFPGATLWINYHGEVIKNSAYGKTSDRSYSTYALEPVTTKTIYDLASLTKIIATTGAIMHLSERGLLRLTDSVSMYLPLFRSDQQKASVTIGHLLTHTSGLPASPQLYRIYHSNETFGHTGFTGTSMIMNREHDLFAILLSNRVCPKRSGPDINPYRQRIANALLKLCKPSVDAE